MQLRLAELFLQCPEGKVNLVGPRKMDQKGKALGKRATTKAQKEINLFKYVQNLNRLKELTFFHSLNKTSHVEPKGQKDGSAAVCAHLRADKTYTALRRGPENLGDQFQGRTKDRTKEGIRKEKMKAAFEL